jgi:hypothetical protein
MKYHMATTAFLLAALVCFLAGLKTGAVACFVVAGVLEAAFWHLIFRRRPARTA